MTVIIRLLDLIDELTYQIDHSKNIVQKLRLIRMREELLTQLREAYSEDPARD